MQYKIEENAQFSSREVYFDEKPSAEVREALKALKMRWNHKKSCWYGFATAEQITAAINGEKRITKSESKPKTNKFGVQVGDLFVASWGYDQTNVDFFQVVELVGACSVRVRHVCPILVDEDAVSPMASNRTYKNTRELLQPVSSSVFIKDQERGDLKRLKSYAKDGISHPLFNVDSFASASLVEGDTITEYESWYA